ncbi:bifunctional diguanylate cyclase/phosphodiesterase [Cellvibrio sp. pealriver]|uniref:putative bifunctional diguanylate cyclase/phosphodiesterase n=1 Tax=Cellvibrio sp. pealriver TaxID=1622269 RepID=UPI00066FDA6A|nr:EAL domain-containing protein [Cellvibrio sp. pealriver]
MPKFSYLLKLLTFLIGLVVILEAISYLTTRLVINKAVTQNARAELLSGGELFSRIMQKNIEQLALSVKVLTEDFGFKDAVATSDEKTIASALINHSARVKADIGVLITRDGKFIASDEMFGLQITDEFNSLKTQAQNRGQAYDIIIVDGRAYQFVMFAVKAPVIIGLAGMGFEIKQEFSNDLQRLTGLEVSFVMHDGQEFRYLNGTQEGLSRDDLVKQLNRDAQQGEVFVYDDLITLVAPASRQNNHLLAVLQVPLSQVMAPFSRLNVQLFILALVFALLAGIAALFLARSVTRPVLLLADIARKIASGFYTTPIAVTSKDELGDLARAFISMQQAIGEREQQVLYQSEHDPLTGLPNRLRVFPELEDAISRSHPLKKSVYLLVIDIKNFTQINDELSQEIGDVVLREVGQKIARILTHGEVLRLGSDEFLAILMADNKESVSELAELIHSAFKTPLLVNGLQVSIEINIGLASYPEDANSSDSLLRRANLALNEGRNSERRTSWYEQGWDEKHLRRLHLFREFESSLNNGHISLYYQPKINLEKPGTLGAEALVRWHHPEMGFINPEEFIGVIESSGQITLLTRWVLKTAVAQLRIIQLDEKITITCSVNLSALDLLVDDLPAYVAELLQTYKVPAENLYLEITESAIMREADKCLNNLRRLRDLGVTLSIDDFGTGYSSLSQLKKLPVSELKIDKSFILNLDTSADDQLIVRSTIDLGHTLGLSVTAEGVESEAIKLLLRQYGCDTAQGYLYSKPLPANDFIQWVHRYLTQLESSS